MQEDMAIAQSWSGHADGGNPSGLWGILCIRTKFERRVAMKKLGILLAGLVLLSSAPAVASATWIEAAIGGWKQSPSGNFGYNPLGAADRINFKDEARYDDETRLFGRLKIDLPVLPNIYLMITPVEFDGEGQKPTSFRFGNRQFAGNAPFYSKVNLDQYDLALYYGIPFLETATLNTLNVDLGINLRIIDVDLEVGQNATGLNVSRSVVLTVPMVYLGVQVKPVKWMAVEAEGRGIAYSSNRYIDLIGRLKFKPFGPVFAAVGWRHQDLKIDARDIESDMKLKGPFAEAGIMF
jgi:outer membrane protein